VVVVVVVVVVLALCSHSVFTYIAQQINSHYLPTIKDPNAPHHYVLYFGVIGHMFRPKHSHPRQPINYV
jgi:hypothetical protein